MSKKQNKLSKREADFEARKKKVIEGIDKLLVENEVGLAIAYAYPPTGIKAYLNFGDTKKYEQEGAKSK